MGNHSKIRPIAYGDYLQQLIETVAHSEGNSGEFRVSATWKGEFVPYTCGLATGWGSSFALSRYTKHFRQEPPPWSMNVHPNGSRQLMDCAVANNIPLPHSIEIFEIGQGRSNSNHLNVSELHGWATRYLKSASATLTLAESQLLRNQLGSHLPTAITSITKIAHQHSRDVIHRALRRLYRIPVHHDPIVAWAERQLGGWFKDRVDDLPNREEIRWLDISD